jgi:hypothetical protein
MSKRSFVMFGRTQGWAKLSYWHRASEMYVKRLYFLPYRTSSGLDCNARLEKAWSDSGFQSHLEVLLEKLDQSYSTKLDTDSIQNCHAVHVWSPETTPTLDLLDETCYEEDRYIDLQRRSMEMMYSGVVHDVAWPTQWAGNVRSVAELLARVSLSWGLVRYHSMVLILVRANHRHTKLLVRSRRIDEAHGVEGKK